MKFVFEDAEGEVLPSFYELYYFDKSKIIWTGGNGEMWRRVRDIPLFDGFEIMFLDFNPWNYSIIDIYKKMCKQIRRFGYHYIIIPIICSEYKYLTSLSNKYLIDIDIIHRLRNVHSLDEVIVSANKTYEGFCKMCASRSTIKTASVDKEINKELVYFTQDTFDDSLYDKWMLYVSSYEIFPNIDRNLPVSERYVKDIRDVNLETMIQFQNKRIKDCNEWLNSVDTKVTKRLIAIDINWYR